jgi:WD40 repeat protein
LIPVNDDGAKRGRPWLVPLIVVSSLLAAWLVVTAVNRGDDSSPSSDNAELTGDTAAADGAATDTTLEPLPAFDGWVNPASSGRMWSETRPGILTFRGNPTRTYYGQGMPKNPKVLWSYPGGGGLCGKSTDKGDTSTWCGTGWTGQPSVWEQDGKTWVAFGAYDYGVHWLDGQNGQELLPTFKTGDIIKGSVTVDPDGYPLLYTGSRDNFFRVIAMDRDKPTELYKISAYDVQKVWNDDWDGSALVVDDYLFEGGENSWFYIYKLNRGYDASGKVTVNPQLVFRTPGWDDQQFKDLGDKEVSIENSVAISGNTVYFSNSGGLVQGWDISGLKEGKEPTRVFRYWAGEDMDASLVIDADGFIYAGIELERHNARSKEIGQIIKLDPRKPDDPLVWSVKDPDQNGKEGVWGTPALYKDVVIVDTNAGHVMALDRMTGAVVWDKDFGSQTWQSPVVVDDVLVMGDCEGNLSGFDVSDPHRMPDQPLWTVKLSGCIESTPAVWNGRLYVGARGGQFYAIGDS